MFQTLRCQNLVFYLFLNLFLICYVDSKNKTTDNLLRIVGGSPVDISSAPYLVALYLYNEFICGGFLVQPKYVITAAHCVDEAVSTDLKVRGGVTRRSEYRITRGVSNIYLHPQFVSSDTGYDIAVLKLISWMIDRNVRTVSICSSPMWSKGQMVNIYGWGVQNEASSIISNQLLGINVPLVSKEICQKTMYTNITLTNTMFCAGVLGQKDTCRGDSGGPVIYRNQLCGIVSWGYGCARKQWVGIYTNLRVASINRFVYNIIGN